MSISTALGRSIIALTIAIAPLGGATLGLSGVAYAKGGNGNGNSGGGNGNGSSNGGSHGGASSSHGKSDAAGSKGKGKSSNSNERTTLKSLFTHEKTSQRTAKTKTMNPASGFAGMNSLNRNYHAYMHSNDPRMAAVQAYVMAYAEFEAENGPDAIPTDPALSDEALRDALADFTKNGVVTDDALERAKDILGVGPAEGKIDQIRDTLVEEQTSDPAASEDDDTIVQP
jgi:hypothetical protein